MLIFIVVAVVAVVAVVVVGLFFLELAVLGISIAVIGGIGLILVMTGAGPALIGIAMLVALGIGTFAFIKNSPRIAQRINASGLVKREILAGDVVVGSFIGIVVLGVAAQLIGGLL